MSLLRKILGLKKNATDASAASRCAREVDRGRHRDETAVLLTTHVGTMDDLALKATLRDQFELGGAGKYRYIKYQGSVVRGTAWTERVHRTGERY